jgi:hypothetical protein
MGPLVKMLATERLASRPPALSQPRPHVAGAPQRRGVLVLCR